MPTDFELLDAWKAGDKAAGSELFGRYFDSLCRFFRTKVGDEVDDLIQKTLLAALEARDKFRGEASFRTWLFVVARHELYAHLRRRHRTDARFDPLTHSVQQLQTSPSQWAGKQQDRQRILQAMQGLPVEHQILLELYYWEELSAADISRVLEIPEGTIRTRLRRAKQLLSEALATPDEGLLDASVRAAGAIS